MPSASKRPELVLGALKQRNEQLQKSLQNVSQDLRSLGEERQKDAMKFEQQRRKEITKLNREVAWRDRLITKLQEEVALHTSRAEKFRDALQHNCNAWQSRSASGEKEALARERKSVIELEELKQQSKTQAENWSIQRSELSRKLHEAEREVNPLKLKLRQYLTRNLDLNAQNQKLQASLVTMRQTQKGKGAVITKPWEFGQEIRELRSKLEQKDKEILALRQSAKDKDRQLRREQRMHRSSMFLDLPPLFETDFDSGAESLDVVKSPLSVKSADSWTEQCYKPDLEALFRQLSQEHSQLQNAYQGVHAQLYQLSLPELTSSTSDLRDASVLKAKIQALQVDLTECREQNELLEFRILELEEFREKSSDRSDTREMWTDTDGDDVSDSGILSVTSYQTLDEIQSLPDLTFSRSEMEDSYLVQKLDAAKEQLGQLLPELPEPSHKATLLQLHALLEVCQQWSVHKSRLSDSEKSSRANSPREKVDKLQESGIFEAEELLRPSMTDSGCQSSVATEVASCQTDFQDKKHFEDLEKYYVGQIEQLQVEKAQWRKSLAPEEVEFLKEQLERVQADRQAAEEALEEREVQFQNFQAEGVQWRQLAEEKSKECEEHERNLALVLELMAKIHAQIQTLFPDGLAVEDAEEDVGVVVQYLLKRLRMIADALAQFRAKEAAYEATVAQADILVATLQKELHEKNRLWENKEAEWQILLQNGDSLEERKECECALLRHEREYWQTAHNRWQVGERELRHKLEEVEESEAQSREKLRKVEAVISQKERIFYQEMKALQEELQGSREAYEDVREVFDCKEKEVEEMRQELESWQQKYSDVESTGMEVKTAWEEDQENFRLEIAHLKQTLSWTGAQLSQNELSRTQLAENLAEMKEELEKHKCLWQQETAKAQHLIDELAKCQMQARQSTDSLHSQLMEVMDAVEESPVASRAASPEKESNFKTHVMEREEPLVRSMEDLTQLDDFVDQLFDEITQDSGAVESDVSAEDLQQSLIEKESMLTVLDAEANDLTRQLKAQTQHIANLETVVARLQATNTQLHEELEQLKPATFPSAQPIVPTVVRRASAPQPRPRTKMPCAERKSSVTEDPQVPEPAQLRILRRVGADGLLLAWNPPARDLTAGFVIWVDDVQHQRVRSGHRTKALLHGLSLENQRTLKLTMRTVGLDGQFSRPASITYTHTTQKESAQFVQEAEVVTEKAPEVQSPQNAPDTGSRRSKIPRFHGSGYITVIACNVEDSVC